MYTTFLNSASNYFFIRFMLQSDIYIWYALTMTRWTLEILLNNSCGNTCKLLNLTGSDSYKLHMNILYINTMYRWPISTLLDTFSSSGELHRSANTVLYKEAEVHWTGVRFIWVLPEVLIRHNKMNIQVHWTLPKQDNRLEGW